MAGKLGLRARRDGEAELFALNHSGDGAQEGIGHDHHQNPVPLTSQVDGAVVAPDLFLCFWTLSSRCTCLASFPTCLSPPPASAMRE